MLKYLLTSVLIMLIVGCSPIKRDPKNVFPGTPHYSKRVATFRVAPKRAYELAYERANADEQLQYISKKPTVIVGREYVFSMPMASGADLQGYYVNGDTGRVTFHNERKTIPHNK